jgi:hypothetical protein
VGKSILGQSLCRAGAETKIDGNFKPLVLDGNLEARDRDLTGTRAGAQNKNADRKDGCKQKSAGARTEQQDKPTNKKVSDLDKHGTTHKRCKILAFH